MSEDKSEQWKEAYTTPAGRVIYEISNKGNMRRNGKEYSPHPDSDGYYWFSIKHFHKELARLWDPKWFEGCDVHHKDGNPQNNSLENLECLSHSEHAKIHKTGEKHPMYGKLFTEEHKKKISDAKTGEQNPNHKLTEKDVRKIHMLLGQGYKQKDIAEIFHVGQSTISSIAHGKSWKKVYEEFQKESRNSQEKSLVEEF